MSRVAVEQYTGDSFPPHCVITVRATDDGATPPDLNLPVTLTGLKHATIITLEKVADKSLQSSLKLFSEQAGILVTVVLSYLYKVHL